MPKGNQTQRRWIEPLLFLIFKIKNDFLKGYSIYKNSQIDLQISTNIKYNS